MRFKLLATTALVAATWISVDSLPASSAPVIEARDNNREYLKDYGFLLSATESCSSEHCDYSSYIAATPIPGKGESVNEIDEAYSTRNDNAPASIYLYSSQGGKPGTYLTGARYTFSYGTHKARIPISPTYLEKGKKYWVIDVLIPERSETKSVTWLYDDKHTGGALYQYFPEHSKPWKRRDWEKIGGGRPYARVR